MFKALSRWGSQVRSSMGYISNMFGSKSRSKYGEMSEDTEEIFCDALEEPYTDDEHDHTPTIAVNEPRKKKKGKSKSKRKSKRAKKASAKETNKTHEDPKIDTENLDFGNEDTNPDLENKDIKPDLVTKDTNANLENEDTKLTSLVDVHEANESVPDAKEDSANGLNEKETTDTLLVDVSSHDVDSSQQANDDCVDESESSSSGGENVATKNDDNDNSSTDNEEENGDHDADKCISSESDAESVYEDSANKSEHDNSADDDDDHHHVDHDDTKQIVKSSSSSNDNATTNDKNGIPKSSSSASIFKKVHRRVNSYTQRQYNKFDNTHDDENDNNIIVAQSDVTDAKTPPNGKQTPEDHIGSGVDEIDDVTDKPKKKKKKLAKQTRRLIRTSWKWLRRSLLAYAQGFPVATNVYTAATTSQTRK